MMTMFAALGARAAEPQSPAMADQTTSTDDIAQSPAVAPRPVTSAYMLEIGSSHLADTYLSAVKYSGWRAALTYSRRQMMKFDPTRWVMQLDISAGLDGAQNVVRNATMYATDFRGAWAMQRRYEMTKNLTFGVGGATSLDIGVLYLSRNGNNPASARASWTLDLSGDATWRMNIGHMPVTLGISARVPVVGAFFSPNYGELYYEIYLGNTSSLAHFAWPGSYRRADVRLWADLHFGGTSLRVGYHGDMLSTKANNIVTRDISHALTIGIVTEWLSIDTRRANRGYNSASY